MTTRARSLYWLDDADELAKFQAALRDLAAGEPLERYWLRRFRQVRNIETELSDEHWHTLDGLGFPWAETRARQARSWAYHERFIDLDDRPTVDASSQRPRFTRLVTGQVTLDEVLALRNDPMFDDDPLVIWFDRGFAALREFSTPLEAALADRTLTESANYVGFALGRWAHEAMHAAALGYLDEVRDQLQHPPNRLEYFTLRNFGLMARFRSETGLEVIPSTAKTTLADGTPYDLGAWVAKLRRRAGKHRISAPLRAACRAHGIDLKPRLTHVSFQRGIAALDAFRAREGHCEVPLGHIETLPSGEAVKLGVWVSVKRKQHLQGRLMDGYYEALASRGFTWRVFDDRFTTGLKLLTRYVEEHGDASVPQRAVVTTDEGGTFPLGAWVSKQRDEIRKQRIPQDRHAALMNLGFVANVWQDKWARDLEAFDEFVAQHGHGRVPRRYVHRMADGTTVKLGSWCRSTRHRLHRGELSAARIEDLQAHGFVFTIDRPTFEDGLAALAQFHDREGHANVPFRHVEALDDGTTLNLGIWATRVRQNGRRGKLAPEKAAAVQRYGMTFDLQRAPNGERTPRSR